MPADGSALLIIKQPTPPGAADEKAARSAVAYQQGTRLQNCGKCRHFSWGSDSNSTCAKVVGLISPAMWCSHYAPDTMRPVTEMAQRLASTANLRSESGERQAKPFAGRETMAEERAEEKPASAGANGPSGLAKMLLRKQGVNPEETLDKGAQSIDFTQREMVEGPSRGQMVSNDKVTAPRAWKSAPDHETALLSYITPTEADMLRKADVHGSGVDRQMHYGPGGVPSFQGDGTGGGGGGGASGDNSGPSGAEGVAGADQGGFSGGEPDSGGDKGSGKGSNDTIGGEMGVGGPNPGGAPGHGGGWGGTMGGGGRGSMGGEGISGMDQDGLVGGERVGDKSMLDAPGYGTTVSGLKDSARNAGLYGGWSVAGFHEPGMARGIQDALAAMGVGAGEDKLGIGPSVARGLATVMGYANPIAAMMSAPSPARAAASMAGVFGGLPATIGGAYTLGDSLSTDGQSAGDRVSGMASPTGVSDTISAGLETGGPAGSGTGGVVPARATSAVAALPSAPSVGESVGTQPPLQVGRGRPSAAQVRSMFAQYGLSGSSMERDALARMGL